MKRLLSILLALIVVFSSILGTTAVSVMDENDSVADTSSNFLPKLNDKANLLTLYERSLVNQMLEESAQTYQFDFVVATVTSTGNKTAKQYAEDYYDNNGFGYGSNNDGILFLVNMENREYHITTTGYGMEAVSDSCIKYFGEQMLPSLESGEYFDAFRIFVILSKLFVNQAKIAQPYSPDNLPTIENYSKTQLQVYLEFIDEEKYLDNAKKVEHIGAPSSYSVVDINQDGILELFVSSGDGSGFYSEDVYTLSKTSDAVVFIENIYCYGGVRYSLEHKSIEYSYPRNTAMEGSSTFFKLVNNKLVKSFSIYYQTYDSSTPKNKYTSYDSNGNVIENISITDAKREEYYSSCKSMVGCSLFAETDSGLSYSVKNSEASIKDYTGSLSNGKLIVPVELAGCSITEIGYKAFWRYGSKIRTIEIPNSVGKVCYGAFQNCYSLNNVIFRGTKTQWDNIEIDEKNDNLLEASLQTEFDEQKYKHCYAKVIFDAIDESKSTNLSFYNGGYGSGTIQDVDGDGSEELLMCSFSMNANDFPIAVCSVYAMHQNIAIPLIEKEELFTLAGAPSGSCNIVEKDGEKYIVVTMETGETSISGTRTGIWDLYSIDRDSITKVTDIDYTCYSENGNIISSKSSATINGKTSTYSQYANYISQYETLHEVDARDSGKSIPLEELLEYTNTLPVRDKAIAVYTTDQSFSIKTGDSLGLGFAIQKGGELLTEEWKKMSIVVSDNSVVSVSDYKKNQYGYNIQIKGKKEGNTNLTITDMESGLSTIIEVSVYDQYSRTYTYHIENMREFYPSPKHDDHLLTNIYNLNGIYVNNYSCEQKGNNYYVSFDVYNAKNYSGAVDIYDKDGNWIGCREIEKFTNSSSFWEIGQDIYYLATNLHWISYDQESINKKTHIERIEVPIDGYFTISNNFSSSPGTYLFNTSELLLEALLDAIDLGMDGIEPDEFTKLLIDEIQESPDTKSLFMQVFKDKIEGQLEDYAKGIASGRIEEANSELINNFEIIMDAIDIDWLEAAEIATGVGEGALLKCMGPYGMAISGMFDFNKHSDKFLQVLQFSNSINEPYVRVGTRIGGDIIESDGVIVNTNGNTDSEAVLQVFRISNSEVINLVLNSDDPLESYRLYNICFVKNDKTVQPNGKVKVYLPIPEGMDGDTCNVFRQEESGKWTTISAHREGNNIVFETEHFSLYAIVGKEYPLKVSCLPEKLNYLAGEKISTKGLVLEYDGATINEGYVCDPAVAYGIGAQKVTVSYGCMTTEYIINVDGAILGDVDSDGELSIMDATAIQLHIAKIQSMSLLESVYSDTDGDSELSIMDATEIQLFIAKLISSMRGDTNDTVDSVPPVGKITSTNDLASTQTVTLTYSDNEAIDGYYWGTSKIYTNNTYTKTNNLSSTKEITAPGTYYFVVKDVYGNVSQQESITFCRTELNANGGNVSTSYIISVSGKTVSLPTPSKNDSVFIGWNTTNDMNCGINAIKPIADATYYAILMEPANVLLGDYDMNGIVDFNDILQYNKVRNGTVDIQESVGDFMFRSDLNRDGLFDFSDIEIINKLRLGKVEQSDLLASTFNGIKVSTLPKTKFTYGEPLDIEGIKVVSDFTGSSYQIEDNIYVSGYNPYLVGVQELTVHYYQFTTSYIVTIE